MTETKHYCDHCRKEINSMEDFIEVEVETPTDFYETDLCSDCVSELDDIIRKFIGKESKQ